MSAKREIKTLTGLRGIAAAYVVSFHFLGGLPGTNYVTLRLGTFIDHGYLAVDLFFVLSGFVMALNYRDLFNKTAFWRAYPLFLGRRIARIYPLYLCGTIVGYLLARHATSDAVGLVNLHQTLALNLAMVQTWVLAPPLDPPGWSLSTEWAAYLLFPALLSLVFFNGRRRSWIGLFVCVSAVMAFLWLPHILHPVIPPPPDFGFAWMWCMSCVVYLSSPWEFSSLERSERAWRTLSSVTLPCPHCWRSL